MASVQLTSTSMWKYSTNSYYSIELTISTFRALCGSVTCTENITYSICPKALSGESVM